MAGYLTPAISSPLRVTALRVCHCRHFHMALPQLLRPDGIYSFFNGLAATNATFHTVCCRVVAGELARLGISTQFIPLPIDASGNDTWKGVANKYWQLDTYLLPVCQWDTGEQECDADGEEQDKQRAAAANGVQHV